MSRRLNFPVVEIVAAPMEALPAFDAGFFVRFSSQRCYITEHYYCLINVDIVRKQKDELILVSKQTKLRVEELIILFRRVIPREMGMSGGIWFMDAETAVDVLPKFLEPNVPFILGGSIPEEVLSAVSPYQSFQ